MTQSTVSKHYSGGQMPILLFRCQFSLDRDNCHMVMEGATVRQEDYGTCQHATIVMTYDITGYRSHLSSPHRHTQHTLFFPWHRGEITRQLVRRTTLLLRAAVAFGVFFAAAFYSVTFLSFSVKCKDSNNSHHTYRVGQIKRGQLPIRNSHIWNI